MKNFLLCFAVVGAPVARLLDRRGGLQIHSKVFGFPLRVLLAVA